MPADTSSFHHHHHHHHHHCRPEGPCQNGAVCREVSSFFTGPSSCPGSGQQSKYKYNNKYCDCSSILNDTTIFAGVLCEHAATSFCNNQGLLSRTSFCTNQGTCRSIFTSPNVILQQQEHQYQHPHQYHHRGCDCPAPFTGEFCELMQGQDPLWNLRFLSSVGGFSSTDYVAAWVTVVVSLAWIVFFVLLFAARIIIVEMSKSGGLRKLHHKKFSNLATLIGLPFGFFLLGYTCCHFNHKFLASSLDGGWDNGHVENQQHLPLTINQQMQQQHSRRPIKDDSPTPLFPKEISEYVVGMSRVERDDFDQHIHLGVPRDEEDDKRPSQQVTLIYSNILAMPEVKSKSKQNRDTEFMPVLDMENAVRGCDYVNVVLVHHKPADHRRQCLALVPQTEAFHVHRFGRVNPVHIQHTNLLNSSLPLRLISRLTRGGDGHETWKLDSNEERSVNTSWNVLQTYVTQLPQIRQQVSDLLHNMVGPPPEGKTVVVMTTNWGQAELLANFVCTARARALDLGRLLVFALDQQTFELCQRLNLTAYYNVHAFDRIPSKAAPSYGSLEFALVTLAKLMAPHVVSDLGYDLLFQDVDIIWYQNPLEYFENNLPFPNRDIYFVDDGTRNVQHGPFYANSGLYFVRNNYRTRNFFNKLIVMGESVLRHTCDQSTTNVLLSEHASLYGLKVEIMTRRGEGLKFLSGYHFHRMNHANLFPPFHNKSNPPYLFHVCWTKNKKSKIEYFQQLGEWRVQESCLDGTSKGGCCSAEPLSVMCHMPDRPSILPSCSAARPIPRKPKK